LPKHVELVNKPTADISMSQVDSRKLLISMTEARIEQLAHPMSHEVPDIDKSRTNEGEGKVKGVYHAAAYLNVPWFEISV
jgi:hypothetical protein